MPTVEEFVKTKLQELKLLPNPLDTLGQQKLPARLSHLLKIQPEWSSDLECVLIDLDEGDFLSQVLVIAIQRPDKQFRPYIRIWGPPGADLGVELLRLVNKKWWKWMRKLRAYGEPVGNRDGGEVEVEYEDLSAPVE
jgi:hypothetical protein